MTGIRSVSRVALPPDTDSAILKQYYKENVAYMSAEGVLKVFAVILCLVSSVVQLSRGWCAGAPRLVSGAALVALAAAAALACLFSGSALAITNYAPTAWLFIDIVVSCVVGVVLLVTAVLSLALCPPEQPVDYVHGPLGIASAVLVTASAVVTYVSVTKRWDAAARARRLRVPRPAAPAPSTPAHTTECDV